MGQEKRTKEIEDTILMRIASSKDSMEKICEGCGIKRSTFYRWMEKDEELRDKYTRAKEVQADYLAELMIEVAFEDKDDEKPFVGTNHIQRDRLKVDTLKFIASKLKPKLYGDKLDVTSDGDKIKSVDITGLVQKFIEGDSQTD
jgi:hypothetical protein